MIHQSSLVSESYFLGIYYPKLVERKLYIYDIFNAEGAFIGRTALKNYGMISNQNTWFDAKARNNRLYCVQEKDSGFTELVVYKMKWE